MDGSVTPARLPDLFPGVPLVVTGRYRDAGPGAAVTVTGTTRPGAEWKVRVAGTSSTSDTPRPVWARAHLRDLEDRYASAPSDVLERTITETSLRFGVLCRFTAWIAVDSRVVAEGGEKHRVTQPVEMPEGWDMAAPGAPTMTMAAMAMPYAGGPPAAAMPAPMVAAPRSASRGLFRRSVAPKVQRDAFQAHEAAITPPEGQAAPPEPTAAEVEARAALRDQLVREIDGLRAAESAPEYERRELLADLGTRLAAILSGTGLRGFTEVTRLLEELADDRPLGLSADAFTELWDRAIRVLNELAAALSGPGLSPPAGGEPGHRKRREFWKR